MVIVICYGQTQIDTLASIYGHMNRILRIVATCKLLAKIPEASHVCLQLPRSARWMREERMRNEVNIPNAACDTECASKINMAINRNDYSHLNEHPSPRHPRADPHLNITKTQANAIDPSF